MAKPEPNLSAHAEVIIRDGIIRGDFAFGERLSDRRLAQLIGISRTPVREALARLAGEDLVSIRPQSGTFVMHPTAEVIRTVCEMRAVLECGALAIVAERHEASGLDRAWAAVEVGERAVRAGDLSAAACMDAAFHEALVDASGNPLLRRAYRGIADQVEAIRRRLTADADRMRMAAEQHRNILDLVAGGEIKQATADLAIHVRRVQDLATELLATPSYGLTKDGDGVPSRSAGPTTRRGK